MSIEKVRAYFAQFGMEKRILEFDVSSATVELAAQAVGVEGKQIAKTLSFLLGDACILIVAAGDAREDNKKYKERFGLKAKMLAHDDVPEYIGHAVGGVCPFVSLSLIGPDNFLLPALGAIVVLLLSLRGTLDEEQRNAACAAEALPQEVEKEWR